MDKQISVTASLPRIVQQESLGLLVNWSWIIVFIKSSECFQAIGGVLPFRDDGYGVFYSIANNSMLFVITADRRGSYTSAVCLKDHLNKSLIECYNLLDMSSNLWKPSQVTCLEIWNIDYNLYILKFLVHCSCAIGTDNATYWNYSAITILFVGLYGL